MASVAVSPQRRIEILDALRRGTVPRAGLASFAVGLDHLLPSLDEELQRIKMGGTGFKAVRGEYGSGKTFFSRWLQEHSRRIGLATAEVQISETETPLHRLETVYRRLIERLGTADTPEAAFRSVVEGWFYVLEQDVLGGGEVRENDTASLLQRTNELLEQRLAVVSRAAPTFAAGLRGYREAVSRGDVRTADALLAWLAGQPNVGAESTRLAGIKGDVDHFAALNFLQGLLLILRDSGFGGLVLVLDEVETLQRVRGDVREKGLNALRQLVDEIDAGRFPGLYLVVTGTPPFFDGPQGAQRLPPLAQRLHVDFGDPRFDNPRAVQIRLRGFSAELLQEVGRRVRALFASGSPQADRLGRLADDSYIAVLAEAVTGELGGRVGVAPRIFLKKLVADVLDRIDQFPEFDPRRDYSLTLSEAELTPVERAALHRENVDDIELST
jgi:hypothetical protein